MALSQKQLDQRKYYIGSSEAKIIASADLEKWHELIEEKHNATSKVFPKSTQRRMDAGSFLEPAVLDWFEEDAKIEVGSYQCGRTRVHKKGNLSVPIHSTYDALTKADPFIPVEAKCHFGMWDMDKIADLYSAQLQHHIFTGMSDYCWLTVFFGLNATTQYRKINRDQEYIDAYLHNALQWWNWYEFGVEPKGAEDIMPAQWTDMYTMDLSELEQFDAVVGREVDSNCQSILKEKEAKHDADWAKVELRHLMPKLCRQMKHKLGGNLKGYQLTMTRTKGREPSIKINQLKEVANG
ncbi:putative nuclease [uncultured Mediterranean phage uvMED]|nr:putative nuclease [uncultured Mediterranean phage uvMED]BAQ87045.1 putative nuclease [uncultured Mediterranean phage uvMED]BAQ87100.1 putative nuclease [uncultured Mediterranean phage uvMED]BAR16591.1 putative nuclease [uncultured Mediterranean phage uvMED]BAR16682.1 putative nuclease [uncultured Mediterranean phage uvMED]